MTEIIFTKMLLTSFAWTLFWIIFAALKKLDMNGYLITFIAAPWIAMFAVMSLVW